MVQGRCNYCGVGEFLPFKCRYCSDVFCTDHRLPESHECKGLGAARAAAREEPIARRMERPVGRRVAASRQMGLRFRLWMTRSVTNAFLVLIAAGFLVQWIGGALYGAGIGATALAGVARVTEALSIGPGLEGLAAKPWSALTSIFVHGGVFHLFFNGLFLFFFGPHVESRIGRRSTAWLFVGAGLTAGVAQVAIFPNGLVLGASGAIMGLLGVLTILAPRMQVFFFFLPLPLFVMTLIFIALDLLAATEAAVFGVQSGVANLAHLVGLAVGLLYGAHLRSRGVFLRDREQWAWQRRL